MSSTDHHGGRELVAFRISDQDFCVDIGVVREIRGWTAATPVPHSPDYMCGVINLRGLVLPIVDLGLRLGMPAALPTPRHAIIVVAAGPRSVGLLVDGVSDILTVQPQDIQAPPNIDGGQTPSALLGVFAQDGRLVSLIAVDRLLPDPEAVAA